MVGAGDVDQDLRPRDRIEIVESRAHGFLGFFDPLGPLGVLSARIERAAGDRSAHSEHAQDSRVDDPAEVEGSARSRAVEGQGGT